MSHKLSVLRMCNGGSMSGLELGSVLAEVSEVEHTVAAQEFGV